MQEDGESSVVIVDQPYAPRSQPRKLFAQSDPMVKKKYETDRMPTENIDAPDKNAALSYGVTTEIRQPARWTG